MVQSVAFAAPSSPATAPSYPMSSLQAQAGRAGTPLAGLEVLAQKRLEQTSTSLEAALKVVENKLAEGSNVDG